jgi:hypothetical protein
MNNKASVFSALLALASGAAQTAEWSGYTALDTRLYAETAAFPGQNTSFAAPSIALQAEFRHEWNQGADRFTAIPFGRYDSLDGHRSHWDVRELNWLHQGNGWNVQAGVGKVFWGVAESRHLVDVINQTDFVENINAEEKLGQPMLNVNVPTAYGNFNVLYLPYFRERTFPSSNGRLRFSLPVDTDHPDRNGISHWHSDWAVRWSRTFGDWDVGIAHFSGVNREPRLVPYFAKGNTAPPIALTPNYDLMNQTSLDVQGALGNWLLKLEAMTRSGYGNRFAAVVAGFEYTHYGVVGSSADLGLLLEYQYDGRDKFSTSKLANDLPTPFDNDVFLGTRLALNDEHNTQFLLGINIDINTQATMLGLEASRRLGDKWKIELESKLFKNIPDTDIISGMRKDDYVQIRFMRFF